MREGLIEIDGAEGEGGGQIVRTAVALAAVTGVAVRVVNIRAGRRKPGLMRQHLTAVRAVAQISGGEVHGAEPGSKTLELRPGAVRGGDYRFDVGSAGSTTLVLQTVLPALLAAPTASRLTLEGGTHNPLAPTFEFLDRAFLPLLRRMGARVEARLDRPGFYPAGGGRLHVDIDPARPMPLHLLERGALRSRVATATVSALPFDIVRRELSALRAHLAWDESCFRPQTIRDPVGPGNVVQIIAEHEHVTEVFSSFGEKGLPAEKVAEALATEFLTWDAADVPVGSHLADQLLLPLAMAGGGSFRTLPPSLHTRTQAALVSRFLPVRFDLRADGAACVVEVAGA
jgi:RNA 3'-terminal phosphate cyclase (ATP)